MKKLKVSIFIDSIITMIAMILMVVENNNTHTGMFGNLEGIGRFVIYMGVTILGLIVLTILVILLIVKTVKKK